MMIQQYKTNKHVRQKKFWIIRLKYCFVGIRATSKPILKICQPTNIHVSFSYRRQSFQKMNRYQFFERVYVPLLSKWHHGSVQKAVQGIVFQDNSITFLFGYCTDITLNGESIKKEVSVSKLFFWNWNKYQLPFLCIKLLK